MGYVAGMSRGSLCQGISNLATFALGTWLCAGYQSLSPPGPTTHPPAQTRLPSLVSTQNLHDVHGLKPCTRTDIRVPPQLVLLYRTVAANGPLVAVAVSTTI